MHAQTHIEFYFATMARPNFLVGYIQACKDAELISDSDYLDYLDRMSEHGRKYDALGGNSQF